MNWKDQSKADWLKKVKQDLRGESPKSIQVEVGEDIRLDPLYTREEVAQLPPVSWGASEGNHWGIAERWSIDETTDMVSLNKKILESLEGGTNTLELELSDISPNSLDEILKDVLLDLVKVRIFCRASIMGEVKAFFSSRTEQNPDYKIYVSETDSIIFLSDDNDLIVSTLTKCIGEIEKWRLDNPDRNWNELLIKVATGSDIPLEVGKIRAMKLLIHAMAVDTGYELRDYPQIQASIKSDVYSDELETIIERTTRAFAAVMASVDEIMIDPLWKTSIGLAESDRRRVIRNIHWLLKSESSLDTVSDPFNGSFWIENYTRALFEAVYEKLQTGGEC